MASVTRQTRILYIALTCMEQSIQEELGHMDARSKNTSCRFVNARTTQDPSKQTDHSECPSQSGSASTPWTRPPEREEEPTQSPFYEYMSTTG